MSDQPAVGNAPHDAQGAALLVIAESSRDPDIAHFVGRQKIGRCLVVRPAGGEPYLAYFTAMERDAAAATGLRLLSPRRLQVGEFSAQFGAETAEFWSRLLATALTEAGCRATDPLMLAGRPALGGVHLALRLLEAAGWRFANGRIAMLRARRAKSGDQLAQAAECAEGVCAAMRRVAAILADATPEAGGELTYGGEPLTAGRLRMEIAGIFVERGLEEPEGNIVAAGVQAAVPHNRGDDRVILRARESIVVDLFPFRDVFADCTRTFCVGEPPERLLNAHRTVEESLMTAHRAAVAGVSGWRIQQLVCERMEQAGYPTLVANPATTRGYVHGLGHGVGLELHELPSFRREAGDDGVLAVGDLFTLEPGLYDPDAGYGVRLEDLCAMGAEGLRKLTPLPYMLDPRRW